MNYFIESDLHTNARQNGHWVKTESETIYKQENKKLTTTRNSCNKQVNRETVGPVALFSASTVRSKR